MLLITPCLSLHLQMPSNVVHVWRSTLQEALAQRLGKGRMAHLVNTRLSIDAADNVQHMAQRVEARVLQLWRKLVQLVIDGIP